VDTLDLAEGKKGHVYDMGLFNQKNIERVERQRKSPITVVIGNPPYNANQVNENDNNKNRKYEVIDRRVAETYARDSKAINKNKTRDAYIKFIRWATDRLRGRDGIVCFVSNSSYLDAIALDGLRKHLHDDFHTLYITDLKGNIRKDSMRDGIPLGEPHTVFGLAAMVGIAIGVLVKNKPSRNKGKILYSEINFRSTRVEKFQFLHDVRSIAGVEWRELLPDKLHNWLPIEHGDEFQAFVPLGTKEAKAGLASAKVIFTNYSNGINSSRDTTVFDFDKSRLDKRMKRFISDYNAEVTRYASAEASDKRNLDDFVSYEKVDWSESLKFALKRGILGKHDADAIRSSLYRPFTRVWLYYSKLFIERTYRLPEIFPLDTQKYDNIVICHSGIGSSKPFGCWMVDTIPCYDLIEKTRCFPFYVYNEDGSGRRENITDWALGEFRAKYKGGVGDGLRPSRGRVANPPLQQIGKWDIFYYVYGLLHHPGYRERFADNLKRELPRIPFAPDFWAFAEAGKKLAELHLNYEKLPPIWEGTPLISPRKQGEKEKVSPRTREDKRGVQFVTDPKAKTRDLYRVEKMRLSKDKRELKANDSISVINIPPEIFQYRLGNRSALEWVIDQYQIKMDKRSGIVSDPNRDDDPQYIVRLVGQVIRVSLETVKIVESLPAEFC
jgi:predicted helicase